MSAYIFAEVDSEIILLLVALIIPTIVNLFIVLSNKATNEFMLFLTVIIVFIISYIMHYTGFYNYITWSTGYKAGLEYFASATIEMVILFIPCIINVIYKIIKKKKQRGDK